MKLILHLVGWLLLLNLLILGLSDFQQKRWCELPDWAGPGLYEHWKDQCPKAGMITVRSLTNANNGGGK